MIEDEGFRARGPGWLRRPFCWGALALALLGGCGDDGEHRATPTATATQVRTATATATQVPTVTPNASTAEACTKLAGCGQCFLNARGQCLADAECAGRISADEARCINGITGCDQAALGACKELGCGPAAAGDQCG